MAVQADRDEYTVRLGTPARPLHPDFEEPRPHVRHRPTSRKLIVVAVLAVLVLLNRSTVEGWVHSALDRAQAPLRALEADEQLRKAEDVLIEQWHRDRSYDVTTERLAELDPEVQWGEIVRYQVCLSGRAAVIGADTATGTRSQLVFRGQDHGMVNGKEGCPAHEGDLRPWGLLAQ